MNKKRMASLLESIFFTTDGQPAKVVSVDGAESGLDHLRIRTQTKEQEEAGVFTSFKIYVTEETKNYKDIRPVLVKVEGK